jgi:hypothetical protein
MIAEGAVSEAVVGSMDLAEAFTETFPVVIWVEVEVEVVFTTTWGVEVAEVASATTWAAVEEASPLTTTWAVAPATSTFAEA